MATIVLIEDEENIVEMYTLKFKESGFELFSATDGETGLELVKTHKPDVVLLDVMMPKMDGFAVLSEIKKDESLKNIPVLLMTNLSQKNDVDKGKQLGAVDYVIKSSMTPTQIVEKTKQYLTKNI